MGSLVDECRGVFHVRGADQSRGEPPLTLTSVLNPGVNKNRIGISHRQTLALACLGFPSPLSASLRVPSH